MYMSLSVLRSAERRPFPASIVDELTYCGEGVASGLYLVYVWIVALEGKVKMEV
jgi:hypothetical protein